MFRLCYILAYKAHIRTVLEYSCAVWDPHQEYVSEKLESVQKRSARFISSNYEYEQCSMTRILNHLNIEPLKHRRTNSRLTLLFKGLNGKAHLPTCQLKKPMRKSKSNHKENYNLIRVRTYLYKLKFMPKTIRDWNSILKDIIQKSKSSTDPVSTFSKRIKTRYNN